MPCDRCQRAAAVCDRCSVLERARASVRTVVQECIGGGAPSPDPLRGGASNVDVVQR